MNKIPPATLKKALTNAVAIVVALSLVFLQWPITGFAHKAAADTVEGVQERLAESTSVDVPLEFEHAYITYADQVIAAPATKVTLPAGADMEFTATPDSGYQVESVTATIDGQDSKLALNKEKKYKLTASEIALTSKIKVRAITAPTVEDAVEVAAAEPAADEAAVPAKGAAGAGDDAAAQAGSSGAGEAGQTVSSGESEAQPKPQPKPQPQPAEGSGPATGAGEVGEDAAEGEQPTTATEPEPEPATEADANPAAEADSEADSVEHAAEGEAQETATLDSATINGMVQNVNTELANLLGVRLYAAPATTATPITSNNATVEVAIYPSESDRNGHTNALTSDYEISVAETLYGAVHYEFNPGAGPTTGRLTYSYQMPENIVAGDKVRSTLYDEAGNVAGTWEIYNNTVYFYYDGPWALAHPNGGGNFNFDFTLDEETTQTGEDNTFSFPGATETVTVKVKDAEMTGAKSNAGVEEGGYVTYTVSLHAQADFSTFTFSDTLGASLDYMEGSFTIDGQPLAVTIIENVDGTHTATAGARSVSKGDHTITYRAKIDEKEFNALANWEVLKDAHNVANWEYGDKDDLKYGSADSWLWVQKNIINKWSGHLWDGNKVLWTIQVNGSDQYKVDLGGYTVSDELPAGMSWFGHFNVLNSSWGQIDQVKIPEGATSFTYTFPADAGANTYYIQYYTYIDNVDGITGQQTFDNTATITPPSGTPPVEVTTTYTYGNGSTSQSDEGPQPAPEVTKEIVDQSNVLATGIVSWHSTLVSDVYPEPEQTSGFVLQYYDSLGKWNNRLWSGGTSQYYKIWFASEPELYAGGTRLVKGVDYQFDEQGGRTYGYTSYDKNFEGDTVPVAFRIRFILDSTTMSSVVANKTPIDIYYDTQCDGTYQQYYNEGRARITRGNTEVYGKSVETTYELTGSTPVTKLGEDGYWDDTLKRYVFNWSIFANRDRYSHDKDVSDLHSPYLSIVDTLPEGMTVIPDSITAKVVRPDPWLVWDPAAVTCDQDGYKATFSLDLTQAPLKNWQKPFYDETGSCYAGVELHFKTALDPAYVVHDGTTQTLRNSALFEAGGVPLGSGHTSVNYSDSVISKTGSQNDGEPVVHYTIRVNEKGQKLDADAAQTTIDLKDTLDYRSTVVLSSIKVTDPKTGEDLTGQCSVTLSNNEVGEGGHTTSAFTVNVPDSRSVVVSYDVRLSGNPGESFEVTNSATLNGITNKQTQSKQWFKVNHADASVYGNNTSISITKTDSSNVVSYSARLAGAVFELYSVDMGKLPEGPITDDGLAAASTLVNTVTTDSDGYAVLVDEYTKAIQYDTLYYFKEVRAPAGYAIDDPNPHFVMTQGSNFNAQNALAESHGIHPSPNTAYNVTDTAKTTTLLKARKVFEGGDLKAGAFTFLLSEGGKLIEAVPNDAEGNVAFSNIEYDAAGTHVYAISEVPGDNGAIGYDSHIATVTVVVTKGGNGHYVAEATYANGGDEAVFTNTYAARGEARLAAAKTLDGKAPAAGAFSFTLSDANGEIQTVTNDRDGNIAFDPIAYDVADLEFVGYDDAGHRYAEFVYTIAENVPDDAVAMAGGKLVSGGMSYDATPRTVIVRATDTGEGELEVTYNGEAELAALTFENEHETVEVSGTKVWDDADDQDRIRPGSVTVRLLANGDDTGQAATVTAEDDWAFSFTGLDALDASGNAIEYTVAEDPVKGYVTAVVGSVGAGFTITNKHTPETVEIPVRKVWDDDNNRDGVRKAEITAKLMVDGVEVPGVNRLKLSEANNWQDKFTDLPKYKDGKEIVYTVAEGTRVASDYEKSVAGNMADGFVITNKHVPATTSVSGSKSWSDFCNYLGDRPSSVKVALLADGVEVATAVVTPDGNGMWSYEFTDLPLYRADGSGQKINYTVAEPEVVDYSVTASDNNLTNAPNPETIPLTVKKVWDDANDADHMRPDSVTVRLFLGDLEVDHAELTAANGWTYTWTGLPKHRNGKDAEYRVVEGQVAGYNEPVVAGNVAEGFTITNTRTPDTGDTTLTLYKESAITGRNLVGAQFTLTDADDPARVETATTDWNGMVTFKKLLRGRSYILQETSAPGGYRLDSTQHRITVSDEANPVVSCTDGSLPVYLDGTVGYWTWLENQPEGNYGSFLIRKTLEGDDGVWGNATKHPEINTVRQNMWVSVSNIDTGDWFVFQGIGNGAKGTRKVDLYDRNNNKKGQVTVTSAESMVSKVSNVPSGTWRVAEYADGMTSFDGANGARSGSSDTWTRSTTCRVNGEATRLVGTSSDDAQLKTLEITNYYRHNGSLTLKKDFGWEHKFGTVYMGNLLGEDATQTILHNIVFTLTGKNTGEVYTITGSSFGNSGTEQFASVSGNTQITVSYYNRVWTITNLPYDTYTVVETTDGYRDEGQEIDTILHKFYTTGTFEVTRDDATTNVSVGGTTGTRGAEGVSETGTTVEVNSGDATLTVMNTYYRPKVVEVTKSWSIPEGSDYTPGDIEVQLIRSINGIDNNGTWQQGYFYPVTSDDVPEHPGYVTRKTLHYDPATGKYDTAIFSMLPAVTANGEQITYEVREVSADGSLVPMVNGLYTDSTGNVIEGGNYYTDADGLTSMTTWGKGWKVKKNPYPDVDGVSRFYSSEKGLEIHNTYEVEKTSVKATKVWDDGDNRDRKRPSSIHLQLSGTNGAYGDAVELNEGNNWTYVWDDLPKTYKGETVEYRVVETDAPEEYEVSYAGNTADGLTVTDSYKPGVTNVSVLKAWNDNYDQDGLRPAFVKVQLYADGIAAGEAVELSDDHGWSYTWSGLPLMAEGKTIAYTVDEVADKWSDDYDVVITGDAASGFTITNSHDSEKTEVSVEKVWNDDDDYDGLRPNAVTVQLYANGEASGTAVTLDEANDWSYTWTDLDKRAGGEEITYTVAEIAGKTDAYTTAEPTWNDELGAFVIANTHEVEKVSVHGIKTWNDADDQDGKRPASITVNLLANGEKTLSKTVYADKDGNWSFEFANLDKYAGGKEIAYTVSEDEVVGYTVKITGSAADGFTITNAYAPEKTDIAVTKAWNDADDQDGLRPETVRVRLTDGTKAIGEVVLSADNNWTYTWKNLDRKARGADIPYAVEEVDAPSGYTTAIEGNVSAGFTITNTHAPAEVDIEVNKDWNDGNDQDGARAAGVQVQLNAQANGSPVGLGDDVVTTVTLNAANNWHCSWEGLPQKHDGVDIAYSVIELGVPTGYANSVTSRTTEATAEAPQTTMFTVANDHVPEETLIAGTKHWVDDNDNDGMRPESITVHVWDGDDEVASVPVTSATGWTYTIAGLPKYRDGEEIAYRVTEDAVEGYVPTYAEDSYDITNTHEPALTSVSGAKTWNDGNDQDGIRPSSVTIRVMNGDDEVATTTATAAKGWKYEVTGLPKYDHGAEIVYTVVEDVPEGYESSVTGTNLTNTHTPEEISVRGTKTWDDNNNQDGARPTSITVRLLADGTEVAHADVTAADDWTYQFESLPKYKNGKAITYTIAEDALDGYTAVVDGYDLTNTHTSEETSIHGTKTWNDADDQDGKRPESITVRLYADGAEVDSATVTASDDWTYQFENLSKYKNGKAITYTIAEDALDGYTAVVNGYDLANTHTPETTSVSGAKIWDDADDQDGIRPKSITVRLLADGVATDSRVIAPDADGVWPAFTFSDLPVYKDGKRIAYTLAEDEIASYETAEISFPAGAGAIIKNKHVPATVEVSGTKTWDDANNQDGKRPTSITVNLLANGEVVESMIVAAADNWSYAFTNLPKYKAGKEIAYTVTEDAVPGYEAVVSGYNITNTHTPETTSVNVVKTWDDADDYDGLRPKSITVRLYADGTEIGSATVTPTDNWTYTFANLPKYKSGKAINYTIAEDDLESYASIVGAALVPPAGPESSTELAPTTPAGPGTTPESASDSDQITYNLTNTHTPEKVSVHGTKTWSDADNQDGKRPELITVDLLANGSKVADQVVTPDADGAWSFEFTNLDKYAGGKEIAYTVAEEQVEGYTATITGSAAAGFTIDNAYTPEVTSVKVSKTWDDADDYDGLRPPSVTVHLTDGAKTLETVELNDGNGWSYEWAGLDRYAGGAEIPYTVVEDAVPNYAAELSGSITSGFTLKNTHAPTLVDVRVDKVWNDAANQDGMRADSVAVKLNATVAGAPITIDGVDMNVTLSEANGWHHEWPDLPQMRGGKMVVYTLSETDAISGYTSAVRMNQTAATEAANSVIAFTVTNDHAPEFVDIPATKTWDDADDQDGMRPESVTVQLLAGDEPVLADGAPVTATLSEANGWAHTFTNLPKRAAGTEIAYRVVETAVPEGYTAAAGEFGNGYTLTNEHAPDTSVEIGVVKTWDDADNQDGIRPDSAKVQLYADGVAVGEPVELSASNDWRASWTELPKKSSGSVISYTVGEVDVPQGYSFDVSGSMSEGFELVNVHVPDVTTAQVTKVWDDADNQDGKRPDQVMVQLLANDGAYGEPVALSAANGWHYAWSNLPLRQHGEPVNYHVAEAGVPDDYTAVVTGDREEGFVITNSYTPGVTNVTVSKAWDDEGNQDGIRPASVTVRLLADGAPVAAEGVASEVELNEANHWTYTWADLDQMKVGRAIAYTVEEVDVPEGYRATTAGSAADGYVITNVHEPELTQVEATKTWDDDNNRDGVRPTGIALTLYANGESIATQTVVADPQGNWSHTFTDLPKYQSGKAITYTIAEDEPESYACIVGVPLAAPAGPGTNTEPASTAPAASATPDPTPAPYDLINTHTPETTEVSGTKTWVDNDDQDGRRPVSIVVNLIADGKQVDQMTVEPGANPAAPWTYSFTGLPRYRDGGIPIAYTVTEDAVDGYTAAVDGYDIRNTAEVGSLSVTKSVERATKGGARFAFMVTLDDARVQGQHGGMTFVDGVAAFELADGETIEATDLPAGVRYAVTEDETPGYSPASQGALGTIAAGAKSTARFTNTYNATADVEFFAMKALDGRTLNAEEFAFELLENGQVIQTAKNAGDGHARFDAITYTADDLGAHEYQIREAAGSVNGVAYDTAVHDFTVTVSDNGDGTLAVDYRGYDPDAGAAFTNTYTPSGKLSLSAAKRLDGAVPPAGAYEFQLADTSGRVLATATNAADGTVTFPELTFKAAGTYEYVISEVVPQGAQKLGGRLVYDGVFYDPSESTVTIEAIDNFDGTLRFTTSYDSGSPKTFENEAAPEATFPLSATKTIAGRDFRAGDAFTFTVDVPDGAPAPARTSVTVQPTSGTEAAVNFGDITFTTADLGNTYTYTLHEQGAGETVDGLTNDPFAHVVTLTVVDAGDGTMGVVADYENGVEGITFANTYAASAEAVLTATKTLSGRPLAEGEFFFELTGDDLPGTLHASAAADGSIEFPPIMFTQDDAGRDFHYTMREVAGTLGGITYDTREHDITLHVTDNGDGTMGVDYDYGADGADGADGAAPVFENAYRTTPASVQLGAHKALVGGALEAGAFSFELRGVSANAADTSQTVANDASGAVSFDAIEYSAPGTYEYRISEVVPASATDNGDGTLTGADGIIYDGSEHTAVVTVVDDGYGRLVATVDYDGGASGISFGNTALVRTGFTFDKHYFGGVGTFDFTLTAADESGMLRAGDAADYSDAATIVDDGSQAFAATVQNGAFTDGVAKIVFPEIGYVADGDYHYLVAEAEADTPDMMTDKAQYLVHVSVRGGQVTNTIYELLYEGENLGATDDLAFYNNSTVTLGFNSLSAQSYTAKGERVSVYPKAKKFLNDSTDALVGGEFTFELVDEATGSVLAVATNDEQGNIAFFDEDTDPGLAYDEPGTFRYTMREVAGSEADMVYDSSAILLTVDVAEGDDGLVATTTYNGPGGSEPAFYNVKRGMDVTVQKVSRYGGEGLVDCTYALWMVGPDGDALVGEATSDAQGYITFKNVTLMAGQKYYFKEVEAPKGHTVDPYRTAYFSLNATGDALVLVEDTAPDGWHPATEK